MGKALIALFLKPVHSCKQAITAWEIDIYTKKGGTLADPPL